MAVPHSIAIGTRGSKLALAQTQLVVDALKKKYPEIAITVKPIVTKGDGKQSPIPMGATGKDWFTAEIEQALLNGEIDVAVHSMKDIPPEIPKELTTIAVLSRGDPRDVLISKSGGRLHELPNGAVIGTDSVRRKALLLAARPDLEVKSIRGNIDTRIKKLKEEPYDAIVLAAAGLERAGMTSVATEFFDPIAFIPAIGQGILAAQARTDRNDVVALLREIRDPMNTIVADAEQAFSAAVGGGCKVPIGCYAHIDGAAISIDAFVQDEKTGKIRRASVSGESAVAASLATDIAKKLLE